MRPEKILKSKSMLATILIVVMLFQYISLLEPLLKEVFAEDLWSYEEIDGKITNLKPVNNSNISGSLTIPSTINGYPVVSIAESAFEGNKELTYVKIPNSITTIGSYAFSNCKKLYQIEFGEGENEVTIKSYAFYQTQNPFPIGYVTIPNDKIIIEEPNFDCDGLPSSYPYILRCNPGSDAEKFVLESNAACKYYFINPEETTVDGIKYKFEVDNGKITTLTIQTDLTNISELVIPERLEDRYDITKIDNLFKDVSENESIKKIILPESVTEITKDAFVKCKNLEKIEIPESVTKIGEENDDNIFYDNDKVFIICQKDSTAYNYAVRKGIKHSDNTILQFNDVKLYNKIKTILENKIVEYNDNTKSLTVDTADIEEITELDISNSNIADLTGISKFTKLEKLNASNNNIQNFDDSKIKIDTLKELDLSNNKLSDNYNSKRIKFNAENLPNLERLYLNNMELYNDDISDISKLPNLSTLYLESNHIRDFAKVKNINNLSIKNQRISDSIVKKENDIIKIIEYAMADENSNISCKNCKIEDNKVVVDDDINGVLDSEKENATITINGGIADGTVYTMNIFKNIRMEENIEKDNLIIITSVILDSETFFYSIDNSSEKIKYNGKIPLLAGNHTYHIKLFDMELNNYEINLEDKTFAIRRAGKIYIYSNLYADKFYKLEKNGNLTKYTEAIENESSNVIYVKIGENDIREIQIKEYGNSDLEDYSILDIEIGKDENLKIYGAINEEKNSYLFGKKNFTESSNDDVIQHEDNQIALDNKIEKLGIKIKNITKYDNIILVLDDAGTIYKLEDDNKLEILLENTNIKQINNKYALDEEGNILQCNLNSGNLQYEVYEEIKNIDGKIKKLLSTMVWGRIVPFILYEDGRACMIRPDKVSIEISKEAIDISSSVYYGDEVRRKIAAFVLEANKIKRYTDFDSYEEAEFSDSKKFNSFDNDEFVVKINDYGDILTNKGRYIMCKNFQYVDTDQYENILRIGNSVIQEKNKDIIYIKSHYNKNNNTTNYDLIKTSSLKNNIKITKNEENIKNNIVTIKIEVKDDEKYEVELPDGTKINLPDGDKNTKEYIASKNGVYSFKIKNEDGYETVKVVHITNIQSRKDTKIPEVTVTNKLVKLNSDSIIKYSIDDKKTWNTYKDEIKYTKPIYAKIEDEKFECSIIKITLDDSGNLNIQNEEQRNIEGGILTSAVGYITPSFLNSNAIIMNDNSKVLKISKTAANSIAEAKERKKGIFEYLNEISGYLIYANSRTDSEYAGCNYKDIGKSNLTYKDLNKDVLLFNNGKSIHARETNENISIDYAVISDQYRWIETSRLEGKEKLTDEEIENLYIESAENCYYSDIKKTSVKKDATNYTYIDNNGNLLGDIEKINKFKEIVGENTKYVKIIGDGRTFYILTDNGDVYLCEGYDRHITADGNKNEYREEIIVQIVKSNIIDIYDSGTALTSDGKIVPLRIEYNKSDNSIVQNIQAKTDKYLVATHLGLKDGKLYDFSDVYNVTEVTKGKIKKLNEDEKNNAIGIYNQSRSEMEYFSRDLKNNIIIPQNLAEGDSYITAEGIDEDLPEFIDIAEYRDTPLVFLQIKPSIYNSSTGNTTFYTKKHSTADRYTTCIAITKQGQIYAYINGYVVDTGMNLDYFGPTVNYNIDNSNWTNKDINAKISPNTTNEIIYSKIEKEANETEKEAEDDGILRVATADTKAVKNTAVIKTNGKYNYFVMDKKNRTFTGTFEVKNIDKLKPITPVIEEINNKIKITFKDDMPATLDYAKSGIAKRLISYDKEKWIEVAESEILLEKNNRATIYAKTIDNAGNESDIASLTVDVLTGKIIVLYSDINGNAIKDNNVLEGKIGENYKTTRQEIDGYELVEIVGNEEGKYQISDQFVIYKYKKKEEPKGETKEEQKEEAKEDQKKELNAEANVDIPNKEEKYEIPQTGQSRIIYISLGMIIISTIVISVYLKLRDSKENK